MVEEKSEFLERFSNFTVHRVLFIGTVHRYCSSGTVHRGTVHRRFALFIVFPSVSVIVKRPGPRLWTSADSGESVVPSVATASVTQSVSVASEASVDASVGLGAGAAPGWGGAPAQGLDDLVVGLLTQLLARFPPVVPQGLREYLQWQRCSRGLRVCSAAGCGFDGAAYLDMMGHMQRIGTPYFEGGVSRGGSVSEIGAEFPVYQILV
ncbi:unnamed protein product [Microthlaspi erraticum]|uniref:Uncharacterized protein n=1 Tax=Microthlaspi erraticum TaxID=1685480 RepID=A0A6D2I2H8_9BRAS|nr:unnamed protein product [Microthlaspi erraticum]